MTLTKPSVVATIGAFDGIHRGHQVLLGRVVERARYLTIDSLCVTFDPHPDVVLYPERRLTYLSDRQEKQEILRGLGVDHVMVFDFTRELSMLRPDEFLGLILEQYRLAELWVGTDFALGRGRSGTVATLAELGRIEGFEMHVLPPQRVDHEVISSTFIRTLLSQGQVRHASQLLGRRYRVRGTVEVGAARGRQLGFPTANIRPDRRLTVPADGVYAAVVPLDSREWRAVVNLGGRPTFEESEPLLEVHMLDFDGDLYDRQLSVEFVDRIRDVQKFESIDALRAQIGRDVETARAAEL